MFTFFVILVSSNKETARSKDNIWKTIATCAGSVNELASPVLWTCDAKYAPIIGPDIKPKEKAKPINA